MSDSFWLTLVIDKQKFEMSSFNDKKNIFHVFKAWKLHKNCCKVADNKSILHET